MNKKQIILKFDAVCTRDKYSLRRIEGTITADSVIRLIDIADLEANPRAAQVGNVTDEIIESLTHSSEIFHFKTKGILLAADSCEALERNRYKLQFEDEDIEGILDGGHNTFAIALFILKEALGEDHKDIRSVKRWSDLKPVWEQHRGDIEEVRGSLNFLLPTEIIFPQEGAEGLNQFQDAILQIAQARNNNSQLTLETKANKAGYYDSIQKALDPQLSGDVEWKTNDGGRIKAKDIVALTWIPLSIIPESLGLPGIKEFNPVQIYSSKGSCTKNFDKLMSSDAVSKKTKGDMRELTHKGVESAISLMRDIPKLYDLIYRLFPDAYNHASSGFGRINAVRIFDTNKTVRGQKKYLRRAPTTKFYKEECVYDYPDGFIMPLVHSLAELMEYKNEEVVWKTNPFEFLEKNMDAIMENFYSPLQLSNFDPQKVGKTQASYTFASSVVRFLR